MEIKALTFDGVDGVHKRATGANDVFGWSTAGEDDVRWWNPGHGERYRPVLGVSFSKRATWACLEMGDSPQNHNKTVV